MGKLDNITLTLTFKDNTTLSLNGKTDLERYELLLEMDHSDSNLIGNISANELTLAVINNNNVFTPTNTHSPHYGKLDSEIKIVVKDGTIVKGTFFVTEWVVPTSSDHTTADVVAVDRLQNVLNAPVTLLDVDKSISVKDYLTKVFKKVGFVDADIVIDPSLTQVFDFTITNGAKLSSILNDVATSADVFIFMNENDKVAVKPKEVSGVATKTISSEDPIETRTTSLIKVDTTKTLLNSSNALIVEFGNAELSEVKELLSLSGMDVKSGADKIPNYKLKDGNVYELDNVRVVSKSGVTITVDSVTQSTVTLNTNNPTAATVKCDLYVYGKTVSIKQATTERKNDASIAQIGRKELRVTSKLTQNMTDANALADKLWTRINKDVPYITVDTDDEGFLYNLGDIVTVVYPDAFLSFTGYVHNVKYMWDAGDLVESTIGLKAL